MRDDQPAGSLRALFLERYNDFRSQLKRRLGSDDLAHDAMQEAFLKVNDMPSSSSIQQPAAYLFPVSYTHLDVYKRQVPLESCGGHAFASLGRSREGVRGRP